ncbi:MAG: ABC transporter substrate-binding protein [Actinomycetota bacterium]
MNRIPKVIAALSAFAIVAAACGDDDDSSSDTTAEASTDTTEASPETTEASPETTEGGGGGGGDASFVIGTVLPESGALAFLGPPQIEGVQLAADDLAAAGADVAVITGDSGTDGAVAQETVARLLGEGANAIVGAAASGVSQDIIQTLFDGSIPQCSASNTSPAFTGQDNASFYFRTVPPDEAVSPIIADVVASAGHTNVAIVARADDYGTALADLVSAELDGLGTENAIITYDPENVSTDAVVGDVGAQGADAVVLISFDEGIPIIQAALEAGVPADAMYGADGIFSNTLNESVDAENPNVIDGFTVIGASGDADFNARLTEITDGNLIYGGQAYDCVITMALAFAQAGSTDGEALVAAAVDVTNDDGGDTTCTSYEDCAAALEAGEGINYDGVAGPIDLDENGDPTFGRYAIAEFQDGVLTAIDSQDIDLNF